MRTTLRLSAGGQTYRREKLKVPERKSLATEVLALADENRLHDPKIAYRCLIEEHLKLGMAVGREEVMRFSSGTYKL